ncbi:hypothetical protein BDZ89DRAFT_1042969 [Hymenopellis radicata]|nr:hypothetical protein BDZ89DRAFT_1042969 [Hymenopellis radicata]
MPILVHFGLFDISQAILRAEIRSWFMCPGWHIPSSSTVMEPPSATLDEITTDPISSKLLDFDFIPPNGFPTSHLDELEYTLGLERGGLDHYRNNTALMSTKCSGYKANDPRVLRRRTNVHKYMKENNERSTALSKGNASDIKKRRYISMAANVESVVDEQTAKRARSRSGSVGEPPAKRGKTQVKKKRSSGTEGSAGPIAPHTMPTPPLRRSTRKPKNPPKYT